MSTRLKRIIQSFLVFVGLLVVQTTLAQQVTVTGRIFDEENAPAIGVNIVESGTTNGAITDNDGNYTITVSGDATLVFSFIGMESQEIAVNGQTVVNVQMASAMEELEEIVVTGYITQRKVDLTGAVTVVDVDQLLDIPMSNPMQALQGRVPGLYIDKTGRPSGAVNEILIRGMNTLGNNSPLYIIDESSLKTIKIQSR